MQTLTITQIMPLSAAKSKSHVRIVVAGDRYTGKSSLIAAIATDSFPENVPHVLSPTRLAADIFPDRVPVTIIDTSPSLENRGKLSEELKKGDVVVLTYACDQPLSFNRLTSFWLEELRRLRVTVPVIVVGCKLDLRDENEPVSLEELMGPIMLQYREIETCIECSSLTLVQVPDVFYFAQKAVIHPTAPLFDQQTQSLKPRCVRALKRIFLLFDHDMDGALSDKELNDFQVQCFNAPLQPTEIIGVRRVVLEKKEEGVNELGLTLEGFLFLHTLFIEKGRIETTWAVLRKFGYNDKLRLQEDFLKVPSKHAPDQADSSTKLLNTFIFDTKRYKSIELTTEALEFLRGIFRLFDIDNHGALRPAELDELFSTAPENPWVEAPYKDAAEKTTQGNITLKGFLSEWALMTRLDPRGGYANLIYIGYGGTPSSALHVTRKRSVDRKKQKTERCVFHCLVFGPKNAGKSALLNSFLERPFSTNHNLLTGDCYAANVVDQLGGNKKILIMQAIPEDGVKEFLSNKDSLAVCDVAAFVYDSSSEYSWKRATELLAEVARRGEESGYGVPCLVIAAKNDLDPNPVTVHDSVCHKFGIDAPISVCAKTGSLNNVFSRIVSTAECPHLKIPETEAGKKRKHFHRLFNNTLLFMSVGAAFAVVGVAAFRAYTARRNSSN